MRKEIKDVITKLDLDNEYLDKVFDTISDELYEEITCNTYALIFPRVPMVTALLPESNILAIGDKWVVVEYECEASEKIWDLLEKCKCGPPIFCHNMTYEMFWEADKEKQLIGMLDPKYIEAEELVTSLQEQGKSNVDIFKALIEGDFEDSLIDSIMKHVYEMELIEEVQDW